MKQETLQSIAKTRAWRTAAIALAVVLLPWVGTTTGAAQSQAEKHVTSVRLGSAPEGSRVTVVSDSSLNDYEAYKRGDRFYVRIPAASVTSANSGFSGAGFEDAQVQKVADGVIISFRLQPGTTARVDQRLNKLDVFFSTPEFARGGTSPGDNRAAPETTYLSRKPATELSSRIAESGATRSDRPSESLSQSTTSQGSSNAGVFEAVQNSSSPYEASASDSPSPAFRQASPGSDQAGQTTSGSVGSETGLFRGGPFGQWLSKNRFVVLIAGLLLLALALLVIRLLRRKASSQSRFPEELTTADDILAVPAIDPLAATADSATLVAAVEAQPEQEAEFAAHSDSNIAVENELEPEEARLLEEEALLNAVKELELLQRAAQQLRTRFEEEASVKVESESGDSKADASLRAEEHTRFRMEAEILRKAAENLTRERAATETAQRIADDEAARSEPEEEIRRQAEKGARFLAEEQMRRQLHDEARRRVEEEILIRVAEEARRLAQEQVRRRAEEQRLQQEVERRQAAQRQTALEQESLMQTATLLTRRRAEEQAALKKAEEEEQERRLAELEQVRKQAEERTRLRAEQEKLIRAEIEALQQAELEQRKRIEAETRHKAEAEARLKEEEARRQAAELAWVKAEEEARRVAEEARLRTEQEAMLRAAAEARLQEEKARQQAEREARLRAEEETRRLAEEEAIRQAGVETPFEKEGSRRAREEMRRLQEAGKRLAEEARLRAEEARDVADKLRQRTDEEAHQRMAEARLIEEEARRQAETKERLEAEEAARRLAEEAHLRASYNEEQARAMAKNDVEAKSEAPCVEVAVNDQESAKPSITAQAPASTAEAKEQSTLGRGMEPQENEANLPGDIVNRFESHEPRERAAAMKELARLGGDDAFSLVSGAFDDPSAEVRNAAAHALYEIHSDRTASFTRALREGSPERRQRIGAALVSSGIANEAIGNLTGESRENTYDAFSLLFLMAKTGEVQTLLQAIEDHPNTEVRLAVVKLLALSGQSEVVPALRRLAVRGSLPSEVRSAVMEAIYQISSQARERTPSAA